MDVSAWIKIEWKIFETGNEVSKIILLSESWRKVPLLEKFKITLKEGNKGCEKLYLRVCESKMKVLNIYGWV